MIAQMPFLFFAFMLLIFLGMTAAAVFAGVRALRSAAVVKATPTTAIAHARPGYVEFEGTIEAVPGSAVKAPLTGWPCVWFEGKVEKYVTKRQGGHDQSTWETVERWTSVSPFLVRDASGLCIVDPHRADITPTDKSYWHGNAKTPEDRNPPKVGPTESAVPMVDVSGGLKYRYTESRIYAGNPILVLGEFTQLAGDDADDEPNDPKDREGLDQDDLLLEKALTKTTNMIARGSGAKPFIITTTPQADHIALSGRGGLAAMGIALVPAAIAAWLLWARYQ